MGCILETKTVRSERWGALPAHSASGWRDPVETQQARSSAACTIPSSKRHRLAETHPQQCPAARGILGVREATARLRRLAHDREAQARAGELAGIVSRRAPC